MPTFYLCYFACGWCCGVLVGISLGRALKAWSPEWDGVTIMVWLGFAFLAAAFMGLFQLLQSRSA